HVNEVNKVKSKSELRIPLRRELVCVVCEILEQPNSMLSSSKLTLISLLPELVEDIGDYNNHRWSK
ncbi:hypothetical protein QQP08_003193, partial [Theobroma cacao]